MSAIQQLEQQLSDAKVLIGKRQLALKLQGNRDFQRLIMEDFMVNAAAAYVRESGDPALTKEQQQDALNIAQAAGHLRRWLSVQVQMGAKAEEDLTALNESIEEERAQEQDEQKGGE
jgi:hypothetical protein